jgi:predicted dehydrogenase
LFSTGFVLRHAPFYRKIKEILDSGKLGRIVSVEANETLMPAHGGYIMR